MIKSHLYIHTHTHPHIYMYNNNSTTKKFVLDNMETKMQNLRALNIAMYLLVSFFIVMINGGSDLVLADDHSTMRPQFKDSSEREVNDETSGSLKTYIVHVKKPQNAQSGVLSGSHQDLKTWYQTFLPSTTTTTTTTTGSSGHDHDFPRLVHAYKNVATGFAARLTPEEAKAMAKKDGFVSAQPQKIFSLHTTHTPNFLGLFQGLGLWNDSRLGQGVIVGVLDTGIWPDHPSFSDEGVPPPPAKWQGKCDFNGTLCNNKLIGAKNFVTSTASSGMTSSNGQPPFDLDGHGTHTSSTAAGNFVAGANVFGNAKGTAAGMAPLAHIAMYRVCDAGCGEADILAALDAAIDDGVDVLSLSLGGGSAPFYIDSIAVGAFSATKKGIFVSCSAGNSGPDYFTLSNEAPWILTVGASTIDRKIKADVKLGNGEVLDGESLNQPKDFDSSKLYPLVYAGAVSSNETAQFCAPGSLHNADVEGKVVACERGGGVGRIDKGIEVKNAGGFAMILMNEQTDGFSTLADAHVLPATDVSFAGSSKIKAYINSTSSPQSTILFKGTVIGESHAPSVSSFSSRGPSGASMGILKPDIIGPGVSILAAWPVSVDNSTTSGKATFNMISGTSMSCPHLSGIAALLKSSHPDWSPAAIKSAIITTADVSNLGGGAILDEKASPADVFAMGAGHVNPSKANNPGLIYDVTPEDYIPYLCGLGYTDDQVSTITQTTVKCSEVQSIPEGQLNYPTISVVLGNETLSYTRTVTNVGEANSVYTLDLYPPAGTVMNVTPNTLTFTEVNQKVDYLIAISQVSGPGKSTNPFEQGYLVWKSDNYSVRSQITAIFAA